MLLGNCCRFSQSDVEKAVKGNDLVIHVAAPHAAHPKKVNRRSIAVVGLFSGRHTTTNALVVSLVVVITALVVQGLNRMRDSRSSHEITGPV